MLVLEIKAGAVFYIVGRDGQTTTIHGDAHVDAKVGIEAPADVVVLRPAHIADHETPAQVAERWRTTPKPARRAA